MRNAYLTMVVTASLLLTGCGIQSSGDVVTEKEARQFFATAVQRTLNADYAGLCQLAATKTFCEQDVADLRARVPKVAPNIACVYRVPDQARGLERGTVIGGQMLVVEGVDADGHAFDTEVLVFHDGHRLVAQNMVWWSGMGIGVPTPGNPAGTVGPRPGTKRQNCR